MTEVIEFDRAVVGINRTKDPGDGGTIRVLRTPTIVPLKTSGVETRTLAAPQAPGLSVQLNLVTDGGDCVVTVSGGFHQDGSSVLVLDDAGDCAFPESVLVSEDTPVWRLIGSKQTTPSILA